jgi:DNA-binding transcriptional MocR family regulator
MTIDWIPTLNSKDVPLYLAITKAIADDVSTGKLPPDSRLPTHRELADRLKVAIGTITRAYIEAEKRGLIRSEGRRGTFVGESRRGRPALSKMIDSQSHTINLSHNHPNFGDDPDLASALKRYARRPDIQKLLQYPPSAGHLRHREAGAKWFGELGLPVSPESIIVAAGAQHALIVIFGAIAESNDIVLTDQYCYPGMKAVAGMFGLQLHGVLMDDEGMLPDELEALCKQKNVRAIYLNPTLQNPTGIVYSAARRRQLAELAVKYDFLIVEDELLRPLVENPPPFVSSFAPDHCFPIMSSSKTIAAGLRVGFLASPVKYRQRLIDSLQTSMLCVSAIPAELLAMWLEDGTAQKTIQKRQREIALRQQLATAILKKHVFTTHPASPHLWLQLPEDVTGNEFTIETYRRGVAVAPAELFAVHKSSPANALRITLANEVNRDTIKQGLEIIASILRGTPLQDSATV